MQAFASEGLISFHAAAFIVIGMNLGTCITGILASLSSGKNGKCAAFLNLFYNVVKITLATLAIVLIPSTLTLIERLSPGNVARQIANLHMIMNVFAALLLAPGSKLIVRFTERIIRGKDDHATLNQLIYLDRNVLQTPSLAAPLARREICRMGDLARSNLRLAMEAFFELDADKAQRVLEVEQTINYLNHAITGWLVELRALDVSQADREKLGMMFHVVNDIERIGDHAVNIGKWILFADSDDLFLGGWKDVIYRYIDSDYDLVYFKPYSLKEDGSASKRHEPYARLVDNYLSSAYGGEEKIRGRFTVPWSKMVRASLIRENSILFDDDGKVYIVYGNKEIHITELSADMTAPKSGGLNKIILIDNDDVWLGYEGCHFYKINGRYYLFNIHIPKLTGRRTESCFIADKPEGPYIGGDIFDDTRGLANSGVAQGGIIDTPDGKWYAMLFQDSGAVGRMPILIPLS